MKLTHEEIARVAHEANRSYCAAMGDHSQPPWEHAPGWQKQSAAQGIQFLLENPLAGPSGIHESWLEDKKRDGWKWGPEKRPELKEHPCFIPYKELPLEQRAKDYIFLAIVKTLLDI